MDSYVLEGLERAAARLEQSRRSRNECDSFVAVSEALLWVMALDDRLKGDGRYTSSRAKDDGGRAIKGMRHAWNLLKHTDLERLIDLSDHGAAWPMQWPATWFELRWKAIADLPTLKTGKGQAAVYESDVAGRPVRLTLGRAIAFVRQEAARRGYERPAPTEGPP